MAVTAEEIKKIAALSKLSFTDGELEAFAADMEKIIAFADTISSLSGGTDEFDGLHGLTCLLRDDEPEGSFAREDILSGAGGGRDGYFHLPGRKLL